MNSFNFQALIMYLVLPLIATMGTYIIRSLLARIEILEGKMQHVKTEDQIRQIIQDRYDPLYDDIKEIKDMQHKLFAMYIDTIKRLKNND